MKVAINSTFAARLREASGRDPIEQGLLAILEQLAAAGKRISREVARAALTGDLGTSGSQNPTGDSQKNSTSLPTRSVSTP